MKCRSVLLDRDDNDFAAEPSKPASKTATTPASSSTTQTTANAGGGLPPVPTTKIKTSTVQSTGIVGGGLPPIPTNTKTTAATTQAGLPALPTTAATKSSTVAANSPPGLPKIPELATKEIVQQKTVSSSKSSSSSSSSSSWSSSSGNAAADVDLKAAADADLKAVGSADLKSIASFDRAQAEALVQSTLSDVKADSSTPVEATKALPTSPINLPKSTSEHPHETVSTENIQSSQTDRPPTHVVSSTEVLESEPTSLPESSSQWVSDRDDQQSTTSASSHAAEAAHTTEADVVEPTTKDEAAASEEGHAHAPETTGHAHSITDEAVDHPFANGGETEASAEESADEQVEKEYTGAATQSKDTENVDGESQSGEPTATSQQPQSAKETHSKPSSQQMETYHSNIITALDNQGKLASWDKSLGTVSSGLTAQEKSAIGFGCAGVAVFIILLVWALMHRNKLINIVKRRSNGRESLSSQVSLTISDWEKMNQGLPAASDKSKSYVEDQNDEESGTRISRWTGFSSRRSQKSPKIANEDNLVKQSTLHDERDNEELGYDWLELASEGRTGGLSPNEILHRQHQHKSHFSLSPRKRSFVAQSILSSPGIIAKAFKVIVSDDKLKETPAIADVPTIKKKGKLTGLLKIRNGLRSPAAKSPLPPSSARQLQQDGTIDEASPAAKVGSPKPANTKSPKFTCAPQPPHKGARNPFEEIADDWNGASDCAREAQLANAAVQYQPHKAQHLAVPGSYHNHQGRQVPIDIDYVSPTAPRSSVSESFSAGSQRSLALPGGQSPPMTPMTGARIPVPSLLSEPESSYGHPSDMHHSMQSTMDFRQLQAAHQDKPLYGEGMPEAEEALEAQMELSDGGYFVPNDGRSQSSLYHESWFTRSSAEPPSLLDAVPITQEEVRKSRSRNTVRFADV